MFRSQQSTLKKLIMSKKGAFNLFSKMISLLLNIFDKIYLIPILLLPTILLPSTYYSISIQCVY